MIISKNPLFTGKIRGLQAEFTTLQESLLFEKRGYKVVKEQQVQRKKVMLTNFVMKKEREACGIAAAALSISPVHAILKKEISTCYEGE